jgi:hypothetical protein
MLFLSHHLYFLASVSSAGGGSGGSGSRRRSRGTPKQSKSGPFVLKNKLYFHEKEEVPLLKAPDGFVFPGKMKFFINNQTGLKSLFYVPSASFPDAMDGVGIGIMRSTPAGKVYIDSASVDHESEFFFGFKVTLEEIEAMLDEEVESRPEEEEVVPVSFGMAAITIKEEEN